VGASIAGLFSAWRLCSAGRTVVVYDPDGVMATPRTLIVTPYLRRMWPEFPSGLVRHRITGFDLRAGRVRRLVPLEEPDWVIDRSEVRGHLLELARRAGAEVKTGWAFVGREDGSLVFRGRRGGERKVQEKVILAADGARSRVLEVFGLPRPPVLRLLQAQVELPDWANPEHAVVWFVPEDTQYFYWLIPESPNTGVLGVVTEGGRPIRVLLDRFVERVGLKVLAYQSGVAAGYRPDVPWRAERDGHLIFPVGDAGGQVKVTTVGGTVTGVWGGMAAVRAVLGQGWSAARSLRAELTLHYVLRRALSRFTVEDYEQLLRDLGQRVVRTLGAFPRDAFVAGAWRLLRAQPGLLGMAARLWR
jgi:flavin-dependent dehydrogenase